MLVSSSAELREALSNLARDSSDIPVIELSPGEYRGPFLVNAPVTLRGQNRTTVLWRKAGPVLYIRASSVKLEKLVIERTVQPGPLVVYDRGKRPIGKDSMELDGDALISLGELIPGSALRLPLRLEVSARTEIAVTGVYGAQISPALLDGPGIHTVLLSLDANAVQRGEVLLGEISLKSGSATRFYWLSGVVLDSSPSETYLALVSKKQFLHPSPGGFPLDAAHIAAMGLDAGKIPPGEHGIVGRDGSMLYIYLPGQPPSPVMVNGAPLASRSRKLLSEGDTVQIADVVFTVQVPEAPPVEIDSSLLDFPDFDTQFPEPGKLTLRTLKNGWRGQIVSSVPWLSVSPEGYFRLPPARAHTWSIALNAEALALPDNIYDIPSGLLISGANHVQAVDVRLRVHRPEIALNITPIDAGTVELGWAQDRTLTVPIANLGRGDWVGRVVSNVPWLEIVSTMPLSGGPWSEALFQAQFTPDWGSLRVGEHEFPNALRIIVLDDDEKPNPAYPPLVVPVKLRIEPPQGHLSLPGPLIDFPEVERNAPLPDTTYTLRNEGAAPWKGTARALHGWVSIVPEEIILRPGETLDLTVNLLDIPPDQVMDEPTLIDEIEFTAETDSAPLPGNIPVQITLVELPPHLVARPVNFPPFVRGDTPPDGMLSIYNMGPTAWEGRVSANVPWISTPDRDFNAEPGTTVGIPISLAGNALDMLKPGVNFWENALTISGGRGPVMTLVQVDLRDSPVGLVLETPTLNFGQVNGEAREVQPETVRLLNAGTTTWSGQVTLKLPWLSFDTAERTFTLEIPKGSLAEFKVHLNDEAVTIPPGVITEESAIQIISSGHPLLNIRALLIVQEATPWLAVVPPHLTLKDAEAQRVNISNEGARRWTLQVFAVPWLEVTPAELVVSPGSSLTISVRYNPDSGADEAGLALVDSRAVVIVGPGRELEIGVEVSAALLKKIRTDREKTRRKADGETKLKTGTAPVVASPPPETPTPNPPSKSAPLSADRPEHADIPDL